MSELNSAPIAARLYKYLTKRLVLCVHDPETAEDRAIQQQIRNTCGESINLYVFPVTKGNVALIQKEYDIRDLPEFQLPLLLLSDELYHEGTEEIGVFMNYLRSLQEIAG